MSEISAIIKNDYATLLFYPEIKIVSHTFHKPIGGDKFREVLNTGVQLLKDHQANKWLSDDRGNSALSDNDTEWSKSDWFPRAVSAGWKYWALVVPQDTLGRLNMAEFVNSYFEQGLRIAVFTDPETALKWLITCDQSPAK